MNHFEEILRQGQSLPHHNFHQNQQLYDKSTNQSNQMGTCVEQMPSPFDSSPKASMFFFSLNSPRQNADNFQFNTQNTQYCKISKEHIQPIARRLEFQDDASLFCEEEELEQEELSVKEQEQWNFESDSSPPKGKKIKKQKNSKGLKNLSIGVYQIVAEKSQTTYKQVANTLIQKFSLKPNSQVRAEFQSFKKIQKDQHNIKRRVYDALNVLISAELLRKEGKKVICNYNLKKQNSTRQYMEQEKNKLVSSVDYKNRVLQEKSTQLKELTVKYNKIKSLITKNKLLGPSKGRVINFPFVVAKSNLQDVQTISIGKKDVQIDYKGKILMMGDVDLIEELEN